MLIQTKILTSAKGATDKKDIREHLRAVCFDFDTEKNRLTVVGTNAQCMIINTIAIKNDNDIAFCKKYFTDNQAYFFNDGVLDSKRPLTELTEIDNKLVCNGTILTKLDQTYPNWRAILPSKDLRPAQAYCGWSPDSIKQIDKALGRKSTIMGDRPLVNDTEDAHAESLSPHLWKLYGIIEDTETIVLCMPMRL